jgi:hypothetical protein
MVDAEQVVTGRIDPDRLAEEGFQSSSATRRGT